MVKTLVAAFLQFGTASYYGDEFVGRPMADGTIFSQQSMVAAHRTLPLKAKVRVTNKNNGKSVIVTVRDRMGYGDHCIDLSKAAFSKIGSLPDGVVSVKVELVR